MLDAARCGSRQEAPKIGSLELYGIHLDLKVVPMSLLLGLFMCYMGLYYGYLDPLGLGP